jgi:hypothetical protein
MVRFRRSRRASDRAAGPLNGRQTTTELLDTTALSHTMKRSREVGPSICHDTIAWPRCTSTTCVCTRGGNRCDQGGAANRSHSFEGIQRRAIRGVSAADSVRPDNAR